MRPAIILLAFLALAACADERKFYRAGATLGDFKADTYACERDARGVAASFGGGIMAGLEARNFGRRCMEAKGWELR